MWMFLYMNCRRLNFEASNSSNKSSFQSIHDKNTTLTRAYEHFPGVQEQSAINCLNNSTTNQNIVLKILHRYVSLHTLQVPILKMLHHLLTTNSKIHQNTAPFHTSSPF